MKNENKKTTAAITAVAAATNITAAATMAAAAATILLLTLLLTLLLLLVLLPLIRRCIQKSQNNAHNTQVACSSRVSRYSVLRWCLLSECAEWRGWMWKRLIVARVFMCVLHQPYAIF